MTIERAASEGQTSIHNEGNARLGIKFSMPLPEAITRLLYLEYDNSVRVDQLRTVPKD